jgi:hypothetical protein
VEIFAGTELACFQRESEAWANYIANEFSVQVLELDPLFILCLLGSSAKALDGCPDLNKHALVCVLNQRL